MCNCGVFIPLSKWQEVEFYCEEKKAEKLQKLKLAQEKRDKSTTGKSLDFITYIEQLMISPLKR